jgi:rhamnosyl/mannosyltransferase
MRIVQVGKYYPPYRGGIESFLHLLSEQLAFHGHEVEVVVSGTKLATVRRHENGVTIVEAGRVASVHSLPVSPTYCWRVYRSLPGIMNLHAPNPLADLAGWLSSVLTGGKSPLVVTYHSDVVRQKLAGRLLQPLLKAVLRRAARIVTTWPGQEIESGVLREFSEKCVNIPLGIDPAPFADRKPLPEKLQALNSPYFLFVGRMSWYKGLDVLLSALRILPGEARLALIGTGATENETRAIAAEMGVEKKCVWLGNCSEEEKIGALQGCRSLVLPSIAPAEVFGVVQLEAMAAGKPVINTSLRSGVPWVARDGKEALTVAPGSADELAEACRKILEDDDLANRLGEAGRERLREEFTAEKMASRYIELYREIWPT